MRSFIVTLISLALVGCGGGEKDASKAENKAKADLGKFRAFVFKPDQDDDSARLEGTGLFLISRTPIHLGDARGQQIPVTLAVALEENGSFQINIVSWADNHVHVRLMQFLGGTWIPRADGSLGLQSAGTLTLQDVGGEPGINLILDDPKFNFSIDDIKYPGKSYSIPMIYRKGKTHRNNVVAPAP